jgi:hypothetical protein
MRRAIALVVLAAAVSTSGCVLHRKTNAAAVSDEFLVARSAPLIVPPDFNLAPPVAGTAAPSAGEAQQQAIDALFGGPAVRSPGETSLLDEAGRDNAQFAIRSTVHDPDTRVVDKGPETLAILSAPAADTNFASAQAGQ